MQHRFGDRCSARVLGVLQSERIQHLLLQQVVHRPAGGLLDHQPEDHVVRVRVVPVRAGLVDQRLVGAVRDQLRRGPLPERLRVLGIGHQRVGDVVGVAGGHLGELADRHLVGVPQVREVRRHLVVQAERTLFLQQQRQRGDVGDGDGAVAEVHGGGGRHAGHRLADRLGEDLLITRVTRTITARRCADARTLSTTRRTASAWAGSALVRVPWVSGGSGAGSGAEVTRRDQARHQDEQTGHPGPSTTHAHFALRPIRRRRERACLEGSYGSSPALIAGAEADQPSAGLAEQEVSSRFRPLNAPEPLLGLRSSRGGYRSDRAQPSVAQPVSTLVFEHVFD